MSKSRGNVVEPWDVINRHGADAFRWYYFASKEPWEGYRFSVDTVGDAVRHFLLTLWNTYAFWVTYANASGLETGELPYVPKWTSADGSEVTELDRWAVSRLQRTIAEVRDHMDGLRLHSRRTCDRRLHRGALELVRPAQPPPLLGRGLRGARDPALLPRRDCQAAGAVYALHRR